MLLEEVLQENFQDIRIYLIKKYIRESPIGGLPNNDFVAFKKIYEKYYQVRDGDDKFYNHQIVKVTLEEHPRFSTKCFWIYHINGKRYPVRNEELVGKKMNIRQVLDNAAKRAVQHQIDAFISQHPRKFDDAVLDYVVPFELVLSDWLWSIRIKPNDIRWDEYNVNEGKRMTEPLHSSWVKYHQEHARLYWKPTRLWF